MTWFPIQATPNKPYLPCLIYPPTSTRSITTYSSSDSLWLSVLQALWFSSYLSERFQSVYFAENTSPSSHIVCGVPQGSVLVPLLFLYTSDIGIITSKHHINSFIRSRTTTLPVWKPKRYTAPSIVNRRLHQRNKRVVRTAPPTNSNWIQIKPSFFGAPPNVVKINSNTLQPILAMVAFVRARQCVTKASWSTRNWASFSQVNSIACKCYAELRRIKSFHRSLLTDAARILVNNLLVSKIDYCNCLLAGTPVNLTDKHQSVMNAAARIECGLKKYDIITSYMRDSLNWLRVPQRVTFKSCLLTYKIISRRLCTRLFDGTLQSSCTIETEEPLAISCSRRSHHSENNNIVWQPGLRTRWTSRMEQSSIIN